ncbi:MAG: DNA alkylation repair protein [Bacteroidetes bacterium]|nr:DNA alkylation repair protein [Bacteroidota bacterium]
MKEVEELIAVFKKNGKPENLEGMQRYGIRFNKAYGCNIPLLRTLAKNYKKNHELALELWKTGVHEAMIMAFLIDDPAKVTLSQAERWLKDVKSWDICDGLCSNLLDKTSFAYEKALEWTDRKNEFEKRAGFVVMTAIAVHDKTVPDDVFIDFLKIIRKHSTDERNFVRKAVNWSLRAIGKRNRNLHEHAVKAAEQIRGIDSKTSRWIANDALREFKSETTLRILELRDRKKLNSKRR